jgi:hypothetical protein
MVVPAVPFFAKVCVFEGVLIGFMDALPWGEDMVPMCCEWGIIDKVG